jgi:20S proteasome alpha/beta subunit
MDLKKIQAKPLRVFRFQSGVVIVVTYSITRERFIASYDKGSLLGPAIGLGRSGFYADGETKLSAVRNLRKEIASYIAKRME